MLSTVELVQVMIASDLFPSSRLDCNVEHLLCQSISWPYALPLCNWNILLAAVEIVCIKNIGRIFNVFNHISAQLENTGQEPVWRGHPALWHVLSGAVDSNI